MLPLLIYSDQIPDGGELTEFRLVQPVVTGEVSWPRYGLTSILTLNFEAITLENGELALGNWGEGFVDRRHPHTTVHELMITWASPEHRTWQLGAGAGKGFATFGTDDPMSRPVVRYPVNHHLAQILQRAVLLGQVRWNRVLLEGSLFNGDEPEEPDQWPNLERFADSWAIRATLTPWDGIEAQVSHALVVSPEHREGAGLDHRQWSASVRLDRGTADRRYYALAEWARSDVGEDDFRFESLLLEGAICWGRVRPYYRFERTERPEEERVSAFRSRRPPLDNSIVGISRWTTHTAGVGMRWGWTRFGLEPLMELTVGRIDKVGEGLFQVSDWYGSPNLLSLSLGMRVDFDMDGHRMGRYGVAGLPHHAESGR